MLASQKITLLILFFACLAGTVVVADSSDTRLSQLVSAEVKQVLSVGVLGQVYDYGIDGIYMKTPPYYFNEANFQYQFNKKNDQYVNQLVSQALSEALQSQTQLPTPNEADDTSELNIGMLGPTQSEIWQLSAKVEAYLLAEVKAQNRSLESLYVHLSLGGVNRNEQSTELARLKELVLQFLATASLKKDDLFLNRNLVFQQIVMEIYIAATLGFDPGRAKIILKSDNKDNATWLNINSNCKSSTLFEKLMRSTIDGGRRSICKRAKGIARFVENNSDIFNFRKRVVESSNFFIIGQYDDEKVKAALFENGNPDLYIKPNWLRQNGLEFQFGILENINRELRRGTSEKISTKDQVSKAEALVRNWSHALLTRLLLNASMTKPIESGEANAH